jgi:hypothetical protein
VRRGLSVLRLRGPASAAVQRNDDMAVGENTRCVEMVDDNKRQVDEAGTNRGEIKTSELSGLRTNGKG